MSWRPASIPFEAQKALQIMYKGHTLKKEYVPDFVCYQQIILELKALAQLSGVEEAQALNYLKATNIPSGTPPEFRKSRQVGMEAARLVRAFFVHLRVLRGCLRGLSQNVLHHFAMDIRQPEMPALELVSQALVVDAQAVQQRRLQIVDMHRVLHDVVAIVVGLAQADAGLDAASGNPHGKAARMMVSAIVRVCQLALAIDGSAKLATPDHQSLIQKPLLLQILNQSCRSLIGPFALQRQVARQIIMLIPAAVIELDKADAAL